MGIDPTYYEAATVDGASKWQRIRNVTIPQLTPLVTVLTILAVGNIFRADFGLFYQIPHNAGQLYNVTNVLDVYVYNGLTQTADIGWLQRQVSTNQLSAWFWLSYQTYLQDELIQTQPCSRKEENMAEKKIKKEKIDNVGIHSFSKKADIFFSTISGLVALSCILPFVFVIVISVTDEKSILKMDIASSHLNLD